MSNYGLGWRPSPFDERDWKPETLRAMVKLGVVKPMAWETPVWLYQGDKPRCVGYSGATFWASAGSKAGIKPDVTNADGDALYLECKIEDGEPGVENGSTLRSLANVLKRRGIIDAYSLTNNCTDVKEWVSNYGCAILGIWWYEGMFNPDSEGFIHPTGSKAGGHAIVKRAREIDRGRLHNTWSKDWGQEGECWLSDANLQMLMNDQGEALLTVKIEPGILPAPVTKKKLCHFGRAMRRREVKK